MINRIRDIRLQKGMTLADVALACSPATTAQTIGRLETGMRTLSLTWMNRIAEALGVDPENLLRSESHVAPQIIATLGSKGPEALKKQLEAVLPNTLSSDTPWLVLTVDAAHGTYREGDQIWCRQQTLKDAGKYINREVLAPLPAGRFAFGRCIHADKKGITLLPLNSGEAPILVDNPAWLALADMLIRKL